jgi:hypothetical protein
MFRVAVDDQLRSCLLVLQFAVGQYAGEFEDAVLDGVQSAHLQVDPKQIRYKVHNYNYARLKPI